MGKPQNINLEQAKKKKNTPEQYKKLKAQTWRFAFKCIIYL